MPDGLKLQAAHLDRLAAIPVEPYPQDAAAWLASLDNGSLAFVANRLLDMPTLFRWADRERATHAILAWLAAERDTRADRLGHHFLVRMMRLDSFIKANDAAFEGERLPPPPSLEGEWAYLPDEGRVPDGGG